jgi:hypothetical protein
MLRPWVKVMLMAILMLIQAACPKFLVQQNNEVRMHPADDAGGSNSGSG